MSVDARSVVAFTVGFGGGWAARSLADSPHGIGVRVLELGLHGRERLERWMTVERERLSDMLAETRSSVSPNGHEAGRELPHRLGVTWSHLVLPSRRGL